MQRKRFKSSTFPVIDQELYQWFLRMRPINVELSCDLLIHQAKLIAASKNVDNFKASKGYFEGFKSRYNIAFKKLHGEGAAVKLSTTGLLRFHILQPNIPRATFSTHPKIQLKSIRLVFFPPNVISRSQPMDMGVIHSLKTNYKNGLQQRRFQLLNVGLDVHPINLLDAIILLKKTGLDGVAASVIVNCFRKAGFSMNLQEPEVLCITDQENDEAEPGVYTDDSLLTSAPM